MSDIKESLDRLSNIRSTVGNLNPIVGDPVETSDYRDYILSDEWKRKRELVLQKRNYHCERCRLYASQLHVHHKTYVRLGKEHWSDLEVLCEYCHQEHHGHA